MTTFGNCDFNRQHYSVNCSVSQEGWVAFLCTSTHLEADLRLAFPGYQSQTLCQSFLTSPTSSLCSFRISAPVDSSPPQQPDSGKMDIEFELAPRPLLRPYIRLIWCLELPSPESFGRPERIAPDGIIEMVFHCGRPDGREIRRWTLRPSTKELAGLSDEAFYRNQADGNDRLDLLSLSTMGCPSFLAISGLRARRPDSPRRRRVEWQPGARTRRLPFDGDRYSGTRQAHRAIPCCSARTLPTTESGRARSRDVAAQRPRAGVQPQSRVVSQHWLGELNRCFLRCEGSDVAHSTPLSLWCSVSRTVPVSRTGLHLGRN